MDVCRPPEERDKSDIIFPEYRTYDNMLLICNKLGGILTVTDGQEKQDVLITQFKRKLPNDFNGYQSCKFLEMYRYYCL